MAYLRYNLFRFALILTLLLCISSPSSSPLVAAQSTEATLKQQELDKRRQAAQERYKRKQA